MAGGACGGTSITNGMKRDAEEAGHKAMTAVLSELLPQTPLRSGSQDTQSKEVQYIASGRIRGGPIDQGSNGKPSPAASQCA